MRHRNPWGQNKEVGGTKSLPFTFVSSENNRIKPITEIPGGQKNKEIGGNTVLLGHSKVPLPVQ